MLRVLLHNSGGIAGRSGGGTGARLLDPDDLDGVDVEGAPGEDDDDDDEDALLDGGGYNSGVDARDDDAEYDDAMDGDDDDA